MLPLDDFAVRITAVLRGLSAESLFELVTHYVDDWAEQVFLLGMIQKHNVIHAWLHGWFDDAMATAEWLDGDA